MAPPLRRLRLRPSAPVRRLAGLALVLMLAGCAGPPTADVVTVPPGLYSKAFDAAVEAARTHGLPAALRDRREGIIETEAAYAPSLLEPWGRDPTGFDKRMAHTIGLHRRRVRFEFAPPPPPGPPPGAPLTGPDLLGLEADLIDRTRYEGALELRVRVYLEQAHRPGMRYSTWTRARTTQTVVVEDGRPISGLTWTPVRRDQAYERSLLAIVEASLAESPADPPADTPDGAASAEG